MFLLESYTSLWCAHETGCISTRHLLGISSSNKIMVWEEFDDAFGRPRWDSGKLFDDSEEENSHHKAEYWKKCFEDFSWISLTRIPERTQSLETTAHLSLINKFLGYCALWVDTVEQWILNIWQFTWHKCSWHLQMQWLDDRRISHVCNCVNVYEWSLWRSPISCPPVKGTDKHRLV